MEIVLGVVAFAGLAASQLVAVFAVHRVRLDQSVVGPNAGLSVHAPILVIADGLNARIMFCRCELAFPSEGRTNVGTVPVKPYGVR